MEINIPISKEKYYKAYTRVLNAVIDLPKGELDVVTSMLENKIYVLTTVSRKKLRDGLNKDQYSFNTIVSSLKKSRTLIKTDEGLCLNPNIVKNISDPKIVFNFKLTDSEN